MPVPETPSVQEIPGRCATDIPPASKPSLKPEDKAALVHAAILEDRAEVRILKERISQTVVLLTTASFGVSAYLLGKSSPGTAALSDLAFLVLLWVAFTPLRRGLVGARRCLEFREDMLRDIGTDRESPGLQIYAQVPEDRKIRIDDKDMDSLVRLAMGLLAAKMVVVLILGPTFKP